MREMKDSGVDWIGKVPANWKVLRNKFIFKFHKDIVGNKVESYERLSLTMNGVLKRSKDDNEGLQPIDFVGYQILKQGDLVFKLIDLQNTSTSRVGLSPFTGLVSPAYISLTPTNFINPSYAELYFLSMWYRNIFNHLGDSGVRSSLNATELLEIPITVPSMPEQTRIASFLDSKYSEIDSITADIQKEIELLQEYRKSVITEAVTKGLDPNVEMKDSGIDWIGMIPKQWDIYRAKNVSTSITKGNGITKEQVLLEGDIQCVRYGEIYSKYKGWFTDTFSKTKIGLIAAPKYIKYGDILFAGTGELVEEIGKNVVFLGQDACLAGGDIVVLSTKQEPRYLNYSFGSNPSQAQKSMNKAKLKVVHISSTDIGNIKVAIPPYEEQIKIANYLDTRCTEIDSLVKDKQKQLNTLAEYRKSLIYEYVTGKKEVPSETT